MTEAPDLFSGIRIGNLTLKSRLVVLPHVTVMTRQGEITPEEVAHWSSLAGEHVGMVITGAASVGPNSTLRHVRVLDAWREENIPGMRRMSDAVHAKGSYLIGQLYHNGREQLTGESLTVSVAPSPIRTSHDFYPPHELDEPEIREIISDFARSARNYKEGGYDGIELHAAHGYLIAQFLSPRSNLRSDAWGGTPEKRLRLLIEIVEAVRTACGEDFALGIRLSGEEENAGGLAISDSAEIARRLALLDQIDYISVSTATRGKYVKDISTPEAPLAEASRIIRGASGLPTILGQRIPRPDLAQELLTSGAADVIGMARGFLADPRLAEKAATGRSEDIRPCIAVNQDCRLAAPHVHCAVNPETGRETLPGFGPIEKSSEPKRVAIIGAGPAGLEAARVAALRGHKVRLFEAKDRTGGQFVHAASLPARAGLIRIVDHLDGQVRKAGVEVELGIRIADAESLIIENDSVIVATGAEVIRDNSLLKQPGVICCADAIEHGVPEPTGAGRAVLADDGSGSWAAYGVANALTDAGWQVEFATPLGMVGFGVPVESVPPLLERLAKGPTHFSVLHALEAFDGRVATLRDVISGIQRNVECSLLIMNTGRAAAALPVSAAHREKVSFIGDCVAPRRISHAILEGYKSGRAI